MKKKVLIHTNKLLPYSETFIKHHVDGLKSFEPTVIFSQKVEGLCIKAKAINVSGGRESKLTEYFFKLGVLSKRLKKTLIREKPCLIHSHFGQNGYTAIPLSKSLNIPNITTFHGFDVTISNPTIKHVGFLHWMFRKRLKRLIKNGHLFIAVSHFIKDKLIELGFPKDQIVVNYLGVDCEKFKPLTTSNRKKTIVCVARHAKYKGIEYLIEAFSLLNSKLLGFQLLLIGDGELHLDLINKAKQYDCDVVFTGRLPQEEIIKILQSASLYVQPSIRLESGHEEALALTIVEAQACGLPCVVFKSGGMPEAISNGKSGLVARPENSRDLASKMLEILTNESLRDSMASEARKFAVEFHNHKTQTEKLEGIYEDLLKERG